LITFLSDIEMRGDGINCDTMDKRFMPPVGFLQYRWLCVSIPYLREAGFEVEICYWRD
jgi:hypothetical protein